MFSCLRGRVLHTGSLEVDAPHFNGVRRVMRHHFGIAQKALGPGLGILTLAAQRPAHDKSVKCPVTSIVVSDSSMTPHHYHSGLSKHFSI